MAASSGDTRQSGSWVYVLEEDGRVLHLADKEVLFIIVRDIYVYIKIYIQEFM